MEGRKFTGCQTYNRGMAVRYLDPRYCNDNSTQILIRISVTLSLAKTLGSLSLAKTQGSAHVRVNQQILLNYFILYTSEIKLTVMASKGQHET